MHPWPGAWLELPDGTVLKVLAADVVPLPVADVRSSRAGDDVSPPAAPSALRTTDGWPVLPTPDGGLRLRTVQPAGKRPMDGDAFLRGRPEVVARG